MPPYHIFNFLEPYILVIDMVKCFHQRKKMSLHGRAVKILIKQRPMLRRETLQIPVLNWNLPFSVTMEPCSLATDRYCCHGFQFMQK